MRATTWGLEADAVTALAAAASTTIDLTADYRTELGVNHLSRYTITRVIGSIFFRADDVPAGDIVQEVSFGIGTFDENTPQASHPNPRTDNSRWMWQRTVRWVPWTVEASAGVFRQLINEVQFDIRTQRIIRGTETNFELVIANITGEDISADVRCRTLYRVP